MILTKGDFTNRINNKNCYQENKYLIRENKILENKQENKYFHKRNNKIFNYNSLKEILNENTLSKNSKGINDKKVENKKLINQNIKDNQTKRYNINSTKTRNKITKYQNNNMKGIETEDNVYNKAIYNHFLYNTNKINKKVRQKNISMELRNKNVDEDIFLSENKEENNKKDNMIYNTDMINEQNVNRVKQLSALAQAGQNLIGLKAESEFIPINNPSTENNLEFNNNIIENDPKNNIAVSKTGYKNLESESYPVYQQDNKENELINNEPKILDDYMNKGEYSNMYKQLVDIANINHEMGTENKLKTLNKNYEIDYNDFNKKHSEQQKKIINKFDQLLNEIN